MSRLTLQKSLLTATFLILSQSAFSATLEDKAKAFFEQDNPVFNCDQPWAQALGQEVLDFGLQILDDAQSFHDLISGKTQAQSRGFGEFVADAINPLGQLWGTTYYYNHQAEHNAKVQAARENTHDFRLAELRHKIFMLQKLIQEAVFCCDDPETIAPCAAYFMTALTKLSIAIADKKELSESLTHEGHIELLGTSFFDIQRAITTANALFVDVLPGDEEAENQDLPVYGPELPPNQRTTTPKPSYADAVRKATSVSDID